MPEAIPGTGPDGVLFAPPPKHTKGFTDQLEQALDIPYIYIDSNIKGRPALSSSDRILTKADTLPPKC